jgi:NAD(P) transhydrogenase subunit alpha
MKIVVPREVTPDELRVALVPDSVTRLSQMGLEVLVESGAGAAAFYSDADFQSTGATIVQDTASLYSQADVVLKVQKPTQNESLNRHEIEMMRPQVILISFLQPLTSPELIRMLAEKRITSFGMDAIPRIARAQRMDALSSMSSLGGYKAVIVAANSLGKYFPMMMTAAGTLPPAKGLVLGAGVAGLQAIATGRRLGAVMYAFDVRPAVKEQVESLGATFIHVEDIEEVEGKGGYAKELSEKQQKRERDLIHRHVKNVDFIITTALVPGKSAPLLITKEMVWDMRPGSVIVDMAAESGGNCELTMPGKEIVQNGVIIHGPMNLPSSMAIHASRTYSRNISELLLHLIKDNQLHLEFEDEITGGCCITHDGHIMHESAKVAIEKS